MFGIASVATGTAAIGLTAAVIGWKLKETRLYARVDTATFENPPTAKPLSLPSREEQLAKLQSGHRYDVLVIGGGATGTGVALDAASRGLSVALVERDDFSSGTSSRSTKLIHGGVRYLQKAIMKLDMQQYKMVKEALHERRNLLEIAPHLAGPLEIMLPVYRWWLIPYYWAGIKMYDLVSGTQRIKWSYFVSKTKALEQFPHLKKEKLAGAIVYYDGQHDDARMNVALALTAAKEGANVANHVEVVSLLKEEQAISTEEGGTETKQVLCGARMRDLITGKEWETRARVVVNATGPFTDHVRKMDDPKIDNICQPSAGVHIVLPSYYSPKSMGLLDPATSDGRVIFFLPWEGATVAGTTDAPTEITADPHPQEVDIQFILQEIRDYLSPDISVRRGDVLAAWSGIRPLVRDPNSKDTQSIARNHIIEVSNSNLVTIAGGKWTTYRSMAQETVDTVVSVGNLDHASSCRTDGLLLVGGDSYYPTLFITLIQDYGLDEEVAKHLAHTYGDQAPFIANMAVMTGRRWPVVGHRLVQDYPYIEAEVLQAVKEYARTATDVIARRTRLAFLNVQAAEDALPRIVEIMATQLKWSKAEKKAQMESARHFLQGMGYKARQDLYELPINLSYIEAENYKRTFKAFDKDGDGHISKKDLRKALEEIGEKVDETQLRDLIAEVDVNQNSTIEEEEFLMLMSALKSGAVANNRMAKIMEKVNERKKRKSEVDRSGGGV